LVFNLSVQKSEVPKEPDINISLLSSIASSPVGEDLDKSSRGFFQNLHTLESIDIKQKYETLWDFFSKSHPNDYLDDEDMNFLKKINKDSEEVAKSLRSIGRTQGNSYGFNKHNSSNLQKSVEVYQYQLTLREFKEIIKKKSELKNEINIIQIGLGKSLLVETSEIFEALKEAFDAVNTPVEDWTVNFTAIDFSENAVNNFLENFKVRSDFKLNIKIAKVDTLDEVAVKQLSSKLANKIDIIFHRNTTYANELASFGLFKMNGKGVFPDKAIRRYVPQFLLGYLLNAYLSIKNVLKYLSSEGTIYVIEQATVNKERNVFHAPGLTVKTLGDYGLSKKGGGGLDNIGTGIYRVTDPHKMEEGKLENFLKSNRARSSSPVEGDEDASEFMKSLEGMTAVDLTQMLEGYLLDFGYIDGANDEIRMKLRLSPENSGKEKKIKDVIVSLGKRGEEAGIAISTLVGILKHPGLNIHYHYVVDALHKIDATGAIEGITSTLLNWKKYPAEIVLDLLFSVSDIYAKDNNEELHKALKTIFMELRTNNPSFMYISLRNMIFAELVNLGAKKQLKEIVQESLAGLHEDDRFLTEDPPPLMELMGEASAGLKISAAGNKESSSKASALLKSLKIRNADMDKIIVLHKGRQITKGPVEPGYEPGNLWLLYIYGDLNISIRKISEESRPPVHAGIELDNKKSFTQILNEMITKGDLPVRITASPNNEELIILALKALITTDMADAASSPIPGGSGFSEARVYKMNVKQLEEEEKEILGLLGLDLDKLVNLPSKIKLHNLKKESDLKEIILTGLGDLGVPGEKSQFYSYKYEVNGEKFGTLTFLVSKNTIFVQNHGVDLQGQGVGGTGLNWLASVAKATNRKLVGETDSMGELRGLQKVLTNIKVNDRALESDDIRNDSYVVNLLNKKEKIEIVGDPVPIEESFEKGGIDFNPKNLDIETRGEGMEFNTPFDPHVLETMDIQGFTPVIFQIVPLTNLPMFLGLTDEHEDEPPFDTAQDIQPLNLSFIDKHRSKFYLRYQDHS